MVLIALATMGLAQARPNYLIIIITTLNILTQTVIIVKMYFQAHEIHYVEVDPSLVMHIVEFQQLLQHVVSQ